MISSELFNGAPIEKLAAYHSGSWSSFGNFPSLGYANKFRIIEDELYAIGGFDTLDGHWCNGIAKRVGNSWEPVGSFSGITGTNIIGDLVKWNGKLIACGAISVTGSSGHDLVYLDTLDNEWKLLGPGIQGGFAQGRSLAVYQGDLYVSGSIPIGANAGHGIMRWDGNQFHPVGTGFQGSDGTYQFQVGALRMLVHDGLLWCAGSFSYAGHVPARGVAVWNGYQWCGVPDIPTPDVYLPVQDIAFYHDTLFAVTGEYDFPVNCVRRLSNVVMDTCSTIVGIESVLTQEQILRVHVLDNRTIQIFGASNQFFHIFNMMGAMIFSGRFNSTASDQTIHIPQLSTGCYVMRTEASSIRFIIP